MAIYNKEVVDKTLVIAGTFGNVSVGEGMKFTVPAAGIATLADEIILGVIPGGAWVFDFATAREALGVGATMDFGYRAVDPKSTLAPALTYWGAAVASATAGVTVSAALPIKFDEAVYIVATVKGALPAVGKYVQAMPLYVYRNV